MPIFGGRDRRGGRLRVVLQALTLALAGACLAVPLLAQSADPAAIPVSKDKPALGPVYWTVFGAAAAGASLDAYTTARYVGHEGHCDHEEMSPWLYGTKAHDARVIAIIAAEVVGSATLSYLLKKKGKKWWSAPLLYTTAIHARGAVNNFSRCR
jgi:hypothetical protein